MQTTIWGQEFRLGFTARGREMKMETMIPLWRSHRKRETVKLLGVMKGLL